MRTKITRWELHHLASIAVAMLMVGSALGEDSRPSIDELLAKHLDSIGTQEARSAVKSRVVQGTVAFNERISNMVHLDGTALLLAQGAKFKCAFQFNSPQYRGEQLVFDGAGVQVAMLDQQARSVLGNFIVNEPEILREGLWGGTLSMGWPLLDVKASGAAKVKLEGEKKIDGRELYEVTYVPKKRSNSGEILIHFYFEPGTFRHVMTVYRLMTAVNQDGTAPGDPNTSTTTVHELFGDFQVVDGVTLPAQWEIRIRVEPGKAQEFQWKVAISEVAHNKL
jgi:hypothetical protein